MSSFLLFMQLYIEGYTVRTFLRPGNEGQHVNTVGITLRSVQNAALGITR